MASRSEILASGIAGYPKCPICGWWDRKLRRVGFAVTPEERVAIHMWCRHDAPFPEWMIPPPKEGDTP